MPGTNTSVSSIIRAFTDSLNILKHLRERRKRKKSDSDAQSGVVTRTEGERRLGRSLKKAPGEIQKVYEEGYRVIGEKYNIGDPIAQASFAETLLKLNTGLVGIISSLLGHGRSDECLDYSSLTAVSDRSRMEAIHALSQLSSRLSVRNPTLQRPLGGCKRRNNTEQSGAGRKGTASSGSTGHSHQQRPKKVRSTETGQATVRRIPVSNSSETQLAIVRPRNRRLNSSTTDSNRSCFAQSPLHTPPTSPEIIQSPTLGQKPRLASRTGPQKPEKPEYSGSSPTDISSSSGDITPQGANHYYRRRLRKETPSSYTFASDSTKLGEIPMRKWVVPFNYDEMERLNAEALSRPFPSADLRQQKPRRGFLRFWKRSSAVDG